MDDGKRELEWVDTKVLLDELMVRFKPLLMIARREAEHQPGKYETVTLCSGEGYAVLGLATHAIFHTFDLLHDYTGPE